MHSFETTIGKLRSEGFKLTPQRLSVIRYLTGNTTHPTAAVIYKDLKRKHPSLSFSTVYNTLNMLEKIGEIQSLHLFDDYLNYDPGTEPHHHFVCRNCNSIIDIFPRDTENVSLPEGDIAGNRIETAQVVFKGMCSSCL